MLQWVSTIIRTKITAVALLTAVVFCFSLAIVAPAFAQNITVVDNSLDVGLREVEQPLGLPTLDIRLLIARIIQAALGLLGIVFLVLVLYGGYTWMTAGGNDEQIAAAKKILTNGVIGVIIVLSAYSIVAFVMNLLGIGGGPDDNSGGGGSTTIVDEENFRGSGGLGSVVKDHYPSRGQTLVPRKTQILITFFKPVDPGSFIANTNGSKDANNNDILGDCINLSSATFNWYTDCDQLVPGSEDLITITRVDTQEKVTSTVALVSMENGGARTVVLKPLPSLGDNRNDITYAVRIGSGLTWADPTSPGQSIFRNYSPGRDFYEWQFTCATSYDSQRPTVVAVVPRLDTLSPKNTVIQVYFSEPMSPIGVQGPFTTGQGYYFVQNSIFLKTDHSSRPEGEFRLTNGYKTLEFTPTKVCGENACGGSVYCLPSCDTGACTQDRYQMLLKAAERLTAASTEGVLFTGFMDASSNVLDGNVGAGTARVFSNQAGDDYLWSFGLSTQTDLTPPRILQVKPGLDADFVEPNSEFSLLFSKPMRIEPMYGIALAEGPGTQPETLCKRPTVELRADGTTFTEIEHCPFLSIDHYYFPVVSSSVEDTNFNCFYPGQGPGGEDPGGNNIAEQHLRVSPVCQSNGDNCCAVNTSTPGQAYCCNGDAVSSRSTTASCLDYLKSISL